MPFAWSFPAEGWGFLVALTGHLASARKMNGFGGLVLNLWVTSVPNTSEKLLWCKTLREGEHRLGKQKRRNSMYGKFWQMQQKNHILKLLVSALDRSCIRTVFVLDNANPQLGQRFPLPTDCERKIIRIGAQSPSLEPGRILAKLEKLLIATNGC